MSNYNPRLHQYEKWVIDASFCITTPLFPLMIYLIVKRSSQMRKYRYYILANVIFDYIYHFFAFLAKPTPLFPSYCLIVDLLVPMPYFVILACFYFTVLSVTALEIAVVASLFYRWSQAMIGRISHFFDQGRTTLALYGGLYFYTFCGISLSLSFGLISNKEEARQQFLTENPDLHKMVDNITVICLINSRYSRLSALSIAVGLSIFFVIGTSLYSSLYFQMQQTRRESSVESTYQMQRILFRALSVELYIGYFCLLFPNTITAILVFVDSPWAGTVGSIGLALFSWHSVLDFLTMLFFITPYRKIILGWIRRNKPEQTSLRIMNN
ncbi:hypothetical protein M3Y96_00413000 [Aphelenchoides besseyi]|nr:hypothetical protein M3Y96_00413000 [Aphelenchoides besseyi]